MKVQVAFSLALLGFGLSALADPTSIDIGSGSGQTFTISDSGEYILKGNGGDLSNTVSVEGSGITPTITIAQGTSVALMGESGNQKSVIQITGGAACTLKIEGTLDIGSSNDGSPVLVGENSKLTVEGGGTIVPGYNFGNFIFQGKSDSDPVGTLVFKMDYTSQGKFCNNIKELQIVDSTFSAYISRQGKGEINYGTPVTPETLIISGGTVLLNPNSTAPVATDGSTSLFCATLKDATDGTATSSYSYDVKKGTETAVAYGGKGYKSSEITTVDATLPESLFFWLPNGDYTVMKGGTKYGCKIDGAAATFEEIPEPLFGLIALLGLFLLRRK